MKLILAVCLMAAVHADVAPLEPCGSNLFVADQEDLCRFWRCSGGEAVSMERCAKGSRVATWYRSSGQDEGNPCTEHQYDDTKCLRCEIDDDESRPEDPNNCVDTVCESGCTCQDLYQAHYCLCPGHSSGTFYPPVVRPDHCNPDQCTNGATCYSQWDDYWCQCLPGYTGKNCEIPVCEPNPCRNGGTCTIDQINYHCACLPGYSGPCCGDGITDPPIIPTTTPPIIITIPKEDSDEFMFTLTFGDASQCGGKKYIYVTPSGAFRGLIAGEPNAADERRVRIYTPELGQGDKCYVDETFSVSPTTPLRYEIIDNDCVSTTGDGEVSSNSAIRVVERDGKNITVTAAPCDYDGYLAIRDKEAGAEYVASPMNYGNYLTIVSLTNNNNVEVYIPNQPTRTYTLNELQSVRVEANNLESAWVRAVNGKVNVWSGDMVLVGKDSIEYESVEQLATASRWGSENVTRYIYFIAGVTLPVDRQGSNFISFQTSVFTEYQFYRWNTTFADWELSAEGSLSDHEFMIMDTRSGDDRWRLSTTKPVQVIHETTEFIENEGFYITSSLARIASQDMYTKVVNFQLHGEMFDEYDYHVVVLNAPAGQLANIAITNVDNAGGDYTQYDYSGVDDLSATIAPSTPEYEYAVVFLNGKGYWTFNSPSNEFGATYYAMTSNVRKFRGGNVGFPLGFKIVSPRDTGTPCPNCEIKASDGRCVRNTGSCKCNPCENTDDYCQNKVHPISRNCTKKVDSSGSQVSIVFMHNSEESDEKREHEIYVTSGAAKGQTVKAYTPYIANTDPCYYEEIFQLSPGTNVMKRIVFIEKSKCYEQKYTGIQKDKMIRVESIDKLDLIVYAVNREKWSTDGWLALPDRQAANAFYVMSYAPAMQASEFSILALEDDTEITIEYGEVKPDRANDFTNFVLNAGETAQIQKEAKLSPSGDRPSATVNTDLTGAKIMASKKVHTWSGNQRALVCDMSDDKSMDECRHTGSRDHLVEQQIPLDAWGMEYIIVPLPSRVIGDHIKVLAATDDTRVEVLCDGANGIREILKSLNAGRYFTFNAYAGNTCKVTSNAKILVAQITKSRLSKNFDDQNDPRNELIHDPSMIFVPPVEQYTNNYIISTPSFSGGAHGSARPYNLSMVLLAAKAEDALDIQIKNMGKEGVIQFSNSAVTLSGQRAANMNDKMDALKNDNWIHVPESDYWTKAVRIQHGMNQIFHENFDVSFMCIYYGADDRESIGLNVNMLLQTLQDRL